MFLSTAITLSAIFLSPVWAQLTMARCPAGFDWYKNSLGQDPCTVGSILDASCRGPTEYTYPPLTDSTQYYLPPSVNHPDDMMCDCNTVMYSLYMACASCQGGKIYSWTQWISECPSVRVSQYPENIPQGTIVPHWAYYDVTLLPNLTWNDSIVMSTRRRHPKELLKRVDLAPSDPSPPSDPSTPPPSIPPSSSTSVPPVPTGTTTIIRDPPGQSKPKDPTSTPNPPGPTTPPGNTNSPDPGVPSGTGNSPGPGTPTSYTDPSAQTITTRDSMNSGPTNPTGSDANSLRPTSPTGSGTNTLQPTNPAGSNTNSNGSGTKRGMSVLAVVTVPLLWALM